MYLILMNFALLFNSVLTDKVRDVAFHYLLKKHKQLSVNDILNVTEVHNLYTFTVGECSQKISSFRLAQKITPNCKEEYAHIAFEYKHINGTVMKVSSFLTPFSTIEKLQFTNANNYCTKIKR